MSTTQVPFREWRDAVAEYESAVEAVFAVSEARGQKDRTVPLVIQPSDSGLAAAVHRELQAGEAVDKAMQRLDSARRRTT